MFSGSLTPHYLSSSSSTRFCLMFSEKKLDSFLTSQLSNSIEKTPPHHRDSCCDIDTSSARNAANYVDPDADNSGNVTAICSTLLESGLKAGKRSHANDTDLVKAECASGQDKCSLQFRTRTFIDDFSDFTNMNAETCAQDGFETDGNCNNVIISDCKHATNVRFHDNKNVRLCKNENVCLRDNKNTCLNDNENVSLQDNENTCLHDNENVSLHDNETVCFADQSASNSVSISDTAADRTLMWEPVSEEPSVISDSTQAVIMV